MSGSSSFYLSPRKPRLRADTWDDVVIATAAGVLDETQWVELKQAVPPAGKAAHPELAKDLASLSGDGGVLIIGIADASGAAGEVAYVGATLPERPDGPSGLSWYLPARMKQAKHRDEVLHALGRRAPRGQQAAGLAAPDGAAETSPALSLSLSRDLFPCPAGVAYGNNPGDLRFRGLCCSAPCVISGRGAADRGTRPGVAWNAFSAPLGSRGGRKPRAAGASRANC